MAEHKRRPRGAPLTHVPEAVTFARERAGLTKRALAEACGFSEQLLNDIESGRRNATPAKLRILSAELNCPLVVLEARRTGVPEPVLSAVPEPAGSAAS
ncbi:multiprotein-bridging factor 1 family protein [Streptomyces sp. MCAF7]